MPRNILDDIDIVEGFPPVDLSAGANSGDYVKLTNHAGCLVVFHSGVGTDGDDPTLTLQQATNAAGGGAKALNFTVIYRKQAATNLAAVTAWTRTTQAAGNTYTNTDLAEQSALLVVDVKADDLDVANGFDWLRATVTDVGANAKPGSLHYILYGPRYGQSPATKLSAIS